MSTDKLFGVSPEGRVPQRKRTPVATADGASTARLHDQQAGRRKRVRITLTDGEAVVPTRRLPNRFDRQHDYARDEQTAAYHRQLKKEQEEHETQRRTYQQRYQEERAKGNYDYNYNRQEVKPRPKRQPQQEQNTARPYGKRYTEQGAGVQPSNKGQGKAPKKHSKKPKAYTAHQQVTPEPVRYAEVLAPDTEIRLNKYLANAGICSRREADTLISAGEVLVNGEVVTELGRRVTPLDVVEYKGNRVEGQSKVYILLNKPKNCVTTSDDPECRLTVMDLVKNACTERIYPVGRLDRQTTGVLLITNDGDLAAKLTHPSFLKKKIYHVWLDKPVSMEHMQAIADGIELEDGEIHADALSYVTEDDLSQVGIEIHSGRNRIVRRIFEHFGYHVQKLDRVYFAGLTKKNLRRGQWRYLDEQEVNNLRMGAFE